MSVAMHVVGSVTVLKPSHALFEGGECDDMEARLLNLVETGAHVVVDLSRVDVLTARCVGLLAHAQQRAVEQGGRIALCAATLVQRELLARLGLSRVLPIHDDEKAAIRSLAPALRSVA